MSSQANAARRTTLVCLLLAAATCAVYAPMWHAQFTNYDDSMMISNNPLVCGGLTLRGLHWALTTFYHEYWHPVTWLSHMLDCQLFGLRPGWHHLVSLGFHVANTLLLFGLLQRMTGSWTRSAMVAALFALHPLHVESVAWIAERKDVLSGFFFMLTLWAYARYAQTTVISSQLSVISNQLSVSSEQRSSGDHRSLITNYRLLITDHRSLLYLLSLLFFALGLMCKPVLMTVPFVLLLLDFWPLGRMGNVECGVRNADSRFTFHASRITDGVPPPPATRHPPLRLLWEKLPFFALTAGSCALAYAWARGSHNLLSTSQEPWGLRLANVPVSYARYLGKMIWPADLFLPYPTPSHWAWWQVGGAVVVLAVITVFVVRRARSAPCLMVGWLIFLGVLVPTIRLVQSGPQSIADRYTYLSSIGLFMAVVWAAADWGAGRRRTAAVTAVAAAALLLCGYLTWRQVGAWRNSFTLWTHCLAMCPTNEVAHFNLGNEFVRQRRWDEAAEHFVENIRLNPANAQAHNCLGKVYALQGKPEEAVPLFIKAIELDPELEEAHFNLGKAYLIKGKLAEAVAELQATLRLKPANIEAQARLAEGLIEAQASLAEALIKLGRAAEALPHCEAVVQALPQNAHARFALGEACLTEKRFEEAVANLKEAVRLAPDVPECLNALAWVYATCPKADLRNGAEAVRLAERACQITKRQKTPPLDTLAAAYAEVGRFDEAVKTAEESRALALSSHDNAAAETARQRSASYKAGKAYRDE